MRSGGQIRIYNILKRLAQTHEITLVSFIRKEEERESLSALDFCKEVHVIMRGSAWQPRYLFSALVSKFSFLLATYENSQMRQLLRDLLVRDTYDVLHVEPFYVWPSIPVTSVPMVISEHNVEYEVYLQYVKRFRIVPMRPLMWLDVMKLTHWERAIWQKARTITAVSPEDAQQITKQGNKSVVVVPNGVDLKQFPYRTKRPAHSAPQLLFVGDFQWFPNTDALYTLLNDIWPKVKQKYARAKLRIVGRHISSNLKSEILASGAEIGEDVEDISVEYRDADMLVAPHGISGGTKFKMLEAMASGLAVITTHEGAAGLQLIAGTHFLLAQMPDEFVDHIQLLWEHKTTYAKMVRSARDHVEKEFSWDAIAGSLEKVWKNV